MVSTRQMSTIASQGTPCEDTCTRISVNTRQSNQALSGMTCPSSSSKISQPCTSVVLSSSLMQSRNHGSVEDGDVRRSSTQRETLTLFDLPMEILDKIFSYVGYKKVGQLRVVSVIILKVFIRLGNNDGLVSRFQRKWIRFAVPFWIQHFRNYKRKCWLVFRQLKEKCRGVNQLDGIIP